MPHGHYIPHFSLIKRLCRWMSVIWTHYSNRTTQQICVAQTRWKPLFSLHLVSLSLEVQFLLQCCRFQEDVLLWLMRWQSAYIMSGFFSQKTAFSPEINSNWDDVGTESIKGRNSTQATDFFLTEDMIFSKGVTVPWRQQ